MGDSSEAYLCINDPNGNGSVRWSESHSHTEQMEETVDAFRRKLKYFFMNPCDKYKARRRKPWKLVLQIIKIAVVTAQLMSFGRNNELVVQFKDETLMAFRHLFLQNFNSNSSMNSYAVYTQQDLRSHVTYIVEQFRMLPNITVGTHEYEEKDGVYTPLRLCQKFFHNGNFCPAKAKFSVDTREEKECLLVRPFTTDPLNLTLHFQRLLELTVEFTLKAINMETVQFHELPDCYVFNIKITFDNKAHSGKISIDLNNDVHIHECSSVTGVSQRSVYLQVLFDVTVMVILLASLILCIRSVKAGVQLQAEYVEFFWTYYGKHVSVSERLEFINGWYILIIISDVLTITGSLLKIIIQLKAVASYDVCSILLGTGTMLVWIGVLRYMGYLKKYNILIITLRAAVPNVMRFTCCAAMIYLGYCFCGWVILGPYHTKFRTLNLVSESLFSLINGDDMFMAFKNMQKKSWVVWLFSRLYLYSFVSLFIYIVLSVFITLITDTYETIKHQQLDRAPASDLQAFIMQCKDQPESGRFRVDETPGGRGCLMCCLHRTDSED